MFDRLGGGNEEGIGVGLRNAIQNGPAAAASMASPPSCDAAASTAAGARRAQAHDQVAVPPGAGVER